MKKVPVKDRFWTKVKKGKTKDCWLWIACTDECGYGMILDGRSPKRAHRVSYELKHGKIKKGLLVLHKCDNPPCVNPKHLYIGTNADNTRDKVSKNRHRYPIGEKSGMSKLTEKLVLKLRYEHFKLGISTCELARKYGFSQSGVYKAIYKETWKHL